MRILLGRDEFMLTIRNLSKSYNGYQALSQVNLDIPSGTIFSLLGPNGSGKTTLLKCLLGLVPFDSDGEIFLNGTNIKQNAEYKRALAYMPQFPGFPPNLTPVEVISLCEQLRSDTPIFKERLISELGIKDFYHKPMRELSGGMKQKVNILQCFMFDFSLALLDEPTSSLDPQNASYVKNFIKELKEKDKTILFTSHILREVEEIADWMAFFSEGRISTVNSPANLMVETQTKNLEEAILCIGRSSNVSYTI
jgi:Cu-processing system ATP-binding protein